MRIDFSRRTFIAGGAAAGLLVGGPARAAAGSGFASDADLLERAYTALHPGLYRYNSAAQMAANFAQARAALATAAGPREAYLALAAATAAVRCGHSYPNFYNQSPAVREELLLAGRNRLPCHFRWSDAGMIVTRDLSGGALPRGSTIVAVEGMPAPEILRRLMPLVRADGHNDAKRRALLGVDGIDEYETFDIYLAMALPAVVGRGAARIAAVDPAGRRFAVAVPLLTAAERRARAPSPIALPKDAPLWQLTRPAPGVAVLTMPTWSVYNGTWDWARWLDTALDDIAGERTLIVDLRGNEGGLDCGDAIVARMIDRDLDPADGVQRVRYRTLPADLAPHVDTWDNGFRDWGKAAVGPRADGFYDLVRGDDGRPPIRPTKRFRGRLVVLVDAMNSSATFSFARLVKDAGLGTLIGEPTGGNRRGTNGGAFLFLRLPATGIEVDIPLIATFPATPQPDAGIVPDLVVRPTPADIAAGTDRVMAAAIAA